MQECSARTVYECHVLRRQRQAHRPLLALVQPCVQRLPGRRRRHKARGAAPKQDVDQRRRGAALPLAAQALRSGGGKQGWSAHTLVVWEPPAARGGLSAAHTRHTAQG